MTQSDRLPSPQSEGHSDLPPLVGEVPEGGRGLSPWTCVTNCTSSKNNQINQPDRERIKNELTIMRGRVTDYQIDDLLNGKPLKIYSTSSESVYIEYKRGQLVQITQHLN